MRQQLIITLAISLVVFAFQPANALQVAEKIDNFRLSDHLGASHELYRWSDKKAIVVMVQGNGCPIVRNAMPRFKEIRDEFAAQGVQFVMLNSNLQDQRQSIAKEVAEFGYDMPVLVDDTQIIGESLDLIRTGEVFVVDPKTWTLAYHGAMDDRLTYEQQKPKAKHHYLVDALQEMVAGKPVTTSSSKPVGCLINFPEKALREEHASISYSNTIAPMLKDNCVSCHRAGGIGPWAMTDYNMVRGFSLMIREVLRTQRMPPWHADPAHGEFSNDRSLAPEQIKQLVHWIEAGSPRGEGPDVLAQQDKVWPVWGMDKPDVIIDIPPTAVPASGTVEYQYKHVKNPLDKDVWVRATAILPSDRSALHHVITTFAMPGPDGKVSRRNRGGISGGLGGYVPGMVTRNFPDGTGVLLPAGAIITFQMHYTSYGKESSDSSKLGLYFHDAAPKHKLDTTVFVNNRIKIPAYSNGHSETSTRTVKQDMLLYSMLPHSHFRGKASEFRAFYPDGTEELLLSVPNYDFNWQTTYQLETPKVIPAGTKVVHRTWWDNSATNPANPDPSRDVLWGEQSWDEMLFGTMSYRVLEKSEMEQLSGLGAR